MKKIAIVINSFQSYKTFFLDQSKKLAQDNKVYILSLIEPKNYNEIDILKKYKIRKFALPFDWVVTYNGIKNIIENYNGTITFESEENVGTEFIVSFPITA